MTTLREDIEARHGNLNRASLVFKGLWPSNNILKALRNYDQGRIYLSSQIRFAKLLGLTLAQFREQYLRGKEW